MRINVYSQELTGEVALVSATARDTGLTYYGVRQYLASPDVLHHSADDDDRSAITYWIPLAESFGRVDLATALRRMADLVMTAPPPG